MTAEMALRPEVRAFAEAIEGRLRRHDADRGESWKGMTNHEAASYLAQRVALLLPAMGEWETAAPPTEDWEEVIRQVAENWEEVIRQAASVGAAAMFIHHLFSDQFGGE